MRYQLYQSQGQKYKKIFHNLFPFRRITRSFFRNTLQNWQSNKNTPIQLFAESFCIEKKKGFRILFSFPFFLHLINSLQFNILMHMTFKNYKDSKRMLYFYSDCWQSNFTFFYFIFSILLQSPYQFTLYSHCNLATQSFNLTGYFILFLFFLTSSIECIHCSNYMFIHMILLC